MDRIAEMRTLVAVADAASFSEAAQRLGLSPPTVTRSIAALERRLGARLVARTTRSLRLTEAGLQFVEDARRALGEIEAAEQSAAGRHARARGTLRLTAPVLFGEQHVAPVVADFVQRHPLVSVDLLLLDRYVNLVEEGVDAGIRIGELPDSSLVATRLGEVRPLVVASPAWLARHGTPTRPEQLRDAEGICFSGERESDWVFVQDGRRLRVPVRGRLGFNHPGAALRACEASAGIGWFLSYQVRDALQAGRLMAVLPDFGTVSQTVQWVMPQARLVPARLRALADAAAAALRPVLTS